MFQDKVRVGFAVFARDGEKAFGAVREVRPGALVIYVENAGDFEVPLSAVRDVHSEKVILNVAKLDPALKTAIGHAHLGEDPRI